MKENSRIQKRRWQVERTNTEKRLKENTRGEAETRADARDLSAVALRYDLERDAAPVVLAKGKGYIAEAIVELARQAGIPSLEEPELLKLLEGVEIGQYIPPEAYTLTAEIIAFLIRLDEKVGMMRKGDNYN